MKLAFSEDQNLLRDSVARLFHTESSPARVRAAEDTGFDPGLWQQLVALGIPLMRVAEDAGGSGMGLVEAVLVAEEAGRHLASVPLAEAVTAAALLARTPGEDAAAALAEMAAGELVALVPSAIDGDTPAAWPGAGCARYHLALADGRLLLVEGIAPGGANLGSAALAVGTPASLGGKVTVLAEGDTARTLFDAAREEWKLLNAAMLVGLGHQALKLAAQYAGERIQFGRPIGGYQGVAHPLADALAECDGAQLLVLQAVWAIANGEADAAATLAMARWWAAKAAAATATKALRTFGGYGVSLEYDIQLYYRRAKAWALVGGDPEGELDEVGERLWCGKAVALPEAGQVDLDFSYGESGRRFAAEVRAFFEANLTPELRAKAHHSEAGYDEGFCKQLAAAGLRFPHWPVEFGGRGVSAFDMAALNEVFEEYNWERLTGPITNQVAQIVMRFAQPEIKARVIGEFARGEALACLGFSEPHSGSDVYAAKTRAVRDGDHWVIDGQKIFTTLGNIAHYIFLLTRTDPELPKHKGMTMFLVPMNTPGIEIQPVHTLQDERTNITYLSNVRIPDSYRVGEVNGAMAVMMSTMELEHTGDHYRIGFSHMLKQAVAWAQSSFRNGQAAIERGDVRRRLAAVAVHTQVARALCYRAFWALENNIPNRVHMGPMSKVFSTEYYQRDAMDLMDLAAPESLVQGNLGLGHVEIGYRQAIGTTIYGGTSEIQRSLVAEHGLGLPKSRS